MQKIALASLITLAATVAQATGPDPDGWAGFTTEWHDHGPNHQGNNTPGDTAADRHNFGAAEAGYSLNSPAAAVRAGKKDGAGKKD